MTPAARAPSPISSESRLRTRLRLLTLLFSPFPPSPSQVDLHYFPAHCFKDQRGGRFSRCLNVGEEVKRRAGFPTGRLGAPWWSAARTPEQTLRTERFGAGGVKESKNIGERLLTSTNVAFIVAFASSHSTVLMF